MNKTLGKRYGDWLPPLDYELVYQLKEAFPELEIIINGGINTIDHCHDHLQYVDGVMVGREAYSNPYLLSSVDQAFYAEQEPPKSRDQVMREYLDYVDQRIADGCRLNQLSRHVVGLYHGEPRSRLWRRHISQNAHLPGSDRKVLEDAYLAMLGSLSITG